jgi:hypothetical protein
VITVIILRTPGIISITAESFRQIPADSSVDINMLLRIMNLSISIALIVVVIIQLIELAKTAYDLFKNRTTNQ